MLAKNDFCFHINSIHLRIFFFFLSVDLFSTKTEILHSLIQTRQSYFKNDPLNIHIDYLMNILILFILNDSKK